MAYKTIFDTKPKKENKKNFCKRIVNLLSDIRFCIDDYIYDDGQKMINAMFKYNKLNTGYFDIDDLIKEANPRYSNIFEIANTVRSEIYDEEILVNIDIIVNCLYSFKKNHTRYFYDEHQASENIYIIFGAIKQYLLSCGYKLIFNEIEDRFFIVDNEIAIDLSQIEDEKVKSDVISFYDYKNAKDIEEKKKILLILIGKLEARKNDIIKIMGEKIADMFSNYANNFNLRHNNISKEYKKYYNPTIAKMNNEETLTWYNYIYAFMMNIYISLENLNDVNINNGYI